MKHCTLSLAAFATFILALAGPVYAAPIAIGNPSFESPDQVNLTTKLPNGSTYIDSWIVRDDISGSGGVDVYLAGPTYSTAASPDPTDGDQFILMTGYGQGGAKSGAVYQTGVVPAALAANTTYTLTFDVGNRDTSTIGDTTTTIEAFFTLNYTDTQATYTTNAVGTPFSMTLGDIANGAMLIDQTATFTTGATDLNHSLNICLKQISTDPVSANFAQSRWDNIRLEATGVDDTSGVDEIASYDFTGAGAASSDTEVNSTAGPYTVSTGGTSGISGSSETAYSARAATTTSEAGAVAAGDFHEFTVTPDAEFIMNLESLEFKQAATSAAGGGDWSSSLFVRSSVDSFAANVGAISTVDSVTNAAAGTDVALDLSDVAFQGITDPVTFRLYLYESGGSAAQEFHRLDDVVLNGTVVPEPSTLALAALGLLGITVCGRRRRRSA